VQDETDYSAHQRSPPTQNISSHDLPSVAVMTITLQNMQQRCKVLQTTLPFKFYFLFLNSLEIMRVIWAETVLLHKYLEHKSLSVVHIC
jgi:hypothetical protein